MPRHRARACWHIAHKRTALPQTEGLFIGAFEKLSCGYPTITLNLLRVDTFSSSFPRRHKEFRLVATTNLFGDILSDQASGLAGGVGLAPSLNAGSDHAMAQAVHGTAPDIAGKGLANPAALARRPNDAPSIAGRQAKRARSYASPSSNRSADRAE